MGASDLSETLWHKSSLSGANSNCVEVAQLPSLTGIRDSKNPDAGHLTVTTTA